MSIPMVEKIGSGNWLQWNRDWFVRKVPDCRVEMLTSAHDYILADIHELSFSRGWSPEDFERLLTDKTVIADGLFIGKFPDPQGFVISRQIEDESEIITIALAPSVRQKGLSRKLLDAHLDVLRHRGVCRVFLEVDENNFAALALYQRLGFKQTGIRKGYYRYPDGRSASALMMKAEI